MSKDIMLWARNRIIKTRMQGDMWMWEQTPACGRCRSWPPKIAINIHYTEVLGRIIRVGETTKNNIIVEIFLWLSFRTRCFRANYTQHLNSILRGVNPQRHSIIERNSYSRRFTKAS